MIYKKFYNHYMVKTLILFFCGTAALARPAPFLNFWVRAKKVTDGARFP
jgi:hypothetical protein